MIALELPVFRRRFVLLPVLAAVFLVGATLLVNEALRSDIVRFSQEVQQDRERLWPLLDLVASLQRAESEQRGFLLTQQPAYADAYYQSIKDIKFLQEQLLAQYNREPEEKAAVLQMVNYVGLKLTEMTTTVELAQRLQMDKAQSLIKTNQGREWMEEVRAQAGLIEAHDRERVVAAMKVWQQKHRRARIIAISGAALNILLIIVAGLVLLSDLQRRTRRTQELNHLVAQRTHELSALSTHLQELSERERSQLARELHDELGSLLVSMKIDLTQLGKRLDLSHPDVQVRWQRILGTINSGVDLKRRIIEELRPTLLDNLGLVAALQWQAQQTCTSAQLTLHMSMPEQESELPPNTAIAVFRAAQEALTNIIKHAGATQVWLRLAIDAEQLLLEIADDGVGLKETSRSGHGLAGMRHRVEAVGGQLQIQTHKPAGLRLVIQVPLQLAEAAA